MIRVALNVSIVCWYGTNRHSSDVSRTILGLKSGQIKLTDDMSKRIAREESYLESVIGPSTDNAEDPNSRMPTPGATSAITQTFSGDEEAFDKIDSNYEI